MFETLLINFLFILLPILFCLIFFENRDIHHHPYTYVVLSIITIFLCMTYPIKLESGCIFDLRYIPYIILVLYVGFKSAFPVYLFINIYRYIISGEGVIQSFYLSTVICFIIPLLHKKFIQLNSRNRMIMASLVSFFTIIFYLFTLIFQTPLDVQFWNLVLNSLTTYLVFMLISMILVERIIANFKAREANIHSEKFHVISELSACVAHEIRNPLTVTNGFLQLLSQSKTIPSEDKKYIEYSLQELHRAEDIVRDFLVFAKPQSNNMVYSNLKDEIDYVTNIMIPYAKIHGVTIDKHFHNSIDINYDKNQVRQCFINLYKNGIEAMKECGGTLTIDVSEQKKNIEIKISDTGVGMTPDQMEQLGSPYYSTKIEGTGLGMVLVYSMINQIKGTIEVESDVGKGTTFMILIPS